MRIYVHYNNQLLHKIQRIRSRPLEKYTSHLRLYKRWVPVFCWGRNLNMISSFYQLLSDHQFSKTQRKLFSTPQRIFITTSRRFVSKPIPYLLIGCLSCITAISVTINFVTNEIRSQNSAIKAKISLFCPSRKDKTLDTCCKLSPAFAPDSLQQFLYR